MIDKIIDLAKKAGEIHMKYYQDKIKYELKNDDPYDFVTAIDAECDTLIRSELKKLYPKDEILSEENKLLPVSYSDRVWIVDPLDGTKDFARKTDDFSVLIGLCKDGVPILGVVYIPISDKLYFAEKNKGAFLLEGRKKKRLQVNTIDKLSDAQLITRNPHGENRPLDILTDKIEVKEKIPRGSVGVKLALIASGEADLHINTNFRCCKWDTCAPQVILEEAGGKITDIDGKELDYKKKDVRWDRSFIGSNSHLHKPTLKNILLITKTHK